MPQIQIHANCTIDVDGWWSPDGTGDIYTDRDGNGYSCDTPLVKQKMVPGGTITPEGSHWIPRCKGKLYWHFDWQEDWEDTEDTECQCPECGCVYEVILSG